MTEIPFDAQVAAIGRLLIYGCVFVVGFRMRRAYHWPVGLAIVFAYAANIALLRGDLFLSGMLGIPFAALNAWIYVSYMRNDVTVLKAHIGAKEAEWSTQRHDLINQLRAAEGREAQLRRIYEPKK